MATTERVERITKAIVLVCLFGCDVEGQEVPFEDEEEQEEIVEEDNAIVAAVEASEEFEEFEEFEDELEDTEEGLFAPLDMTTQAAMASRTCWYDSDCPGECQHYSWSGATLGYCKTIVCSASSQCESGETCNGGICGNTCAVTPDCLAGEECVSGQCRNLQPYSWSYCNSGGCGQGEGDCDNNSHCAPGLTCIQQSGVDTCGIAPGAWDYCSSSNKCGFGLGDCDSNSHCIWPLVCRNNVGASYGFASGVDVCTF